MQEAASEIVVIGRRRDHPADAPMWMHHAEETMTSRHALPAARVVIPLAGAPVHYSMGDQEWTTTMPMVIGLHDAVAIGTPGQVLTLFFDTRDAITRQLPHKASVLDKKRADAVVAIANAGVLDLQSDGEDVARELAQVIGGQHSAPAIDPRVLCAAAELEANPQCPWSMVRLAKVVGLSPSRLAHLFQRDLHVSARSLALYFRAFGALLNVEAFGNNIAHAAAAYGFADQAHLARTARNIFGQPARYAVRSRIVQA